jgi:Domain of unknown function (DUF4190)
MALNRENPPDADNYRFLAPPPYNGLSIASMVCGIAGIPLLVFFGVLSFLAVIFGHIALGQLKALPQRGRGFAIAGLATGYPIVAFWAYVSLYWLYVGLF